MNDRDRELPSGDVTFVFTDIEGSSRLFRNIGERYAPLLERHRQLVRAAVHANSGWEIKTEGDAFFLAFATVAEAVDACVAAQQALQREPWPDDAPIRVRMGVHNGLAHPHEDDYVAYAVHQAARVVGAAHGGQLVLSARAAAQVEPRSPAWALQGLGRYRVRDFDEPIELFQVVAPELAREFPPLRVPPADHHNLMRPPTSFVGREQELDTLRQLVAAHRILTVAGPGGLGKTRLVVEFGLADHGAWPDGVWLADLSQVGDASRVDTVIGNAVGARPPHGEEVWPSVVDNLRERRALLLLDNCEHLVDDVAHRVRELVDACPDLRVVATSRVPLGLLGERVWRPTPLDPGEAASRLFYERTGLDPSDGATHADIRALCERVDGHPLAIELAAARCDVLAPADILRSLDSRRNVIRSADPTLPTRQRSLADLMTWSYGLLAPDEQAALRHLALLSAGFDLETAAVAIADADDSDPLDGADLVWSLASKSLVASDRDAGTTRYRLLNTVREFGLGLLSDHGELERTARRVAHHLIARCTPDGNSRAAALAASNREIDNLRDLVRVLRDVDHAAACRLAVLVVRHASTVYAPDAVDEGLGYLRSLAPSGHLRWLLGVEVADAALDTGQLDLAERLCREFESEPHEPDLDLETLDVCLEGLQACAAAYRGSPAQARDIVTRALPRARTAMGRGRLLNVAYIASFDLGDVDEAVRFGRLAVDAAREIDDPFYACGSLSNLAEAQLQAGAARYAAEACDESLILALSIGSAAMFGQVLGVAALCAAHNDDWLAVARLHAMADEQQRRAASFIYSEDRDRRDAVLQEAASRLGNERYEAERADASASDVATIIEEARRALQACWSPV